MNNKTVLIVDDEDLLRNALVFQFKREGFNVLSAANGKEAFEIIKNNKIDAVVSDIQMPGGNGIDLLKEVKTYDVEIPVLVFITAFADLTEAEAYDLGANAIFTKPFDRKQLIGCIKDSVTYRGRNWKTEIAPLEETKELTSSSPMNVGRGGVFIPMDSPSYTTGEVLKVALNTVLGDETVELAGNARVRWIRNVDNEEGPKGVGLEFIALQEESVNSYEKWLDSHSVKSYIPKD